MILNFALEGLQFLLSACLPCQLVTDWLHFVVNILLQSCEAQILMLKYWYAYKFQAEAKSPEICCWTVAKRQAMIVGWWLKRVPSWYPPRSLQFQTILPFDNTLHSNTAPGWLPTKIFCYWKSNENTISASGSPKCHIEDDVGMVALHIVLLPVRFSCGVSVKILKWFLLRRSDWWKQNATNFCVNCSSSVVMLIRQFSYQNIKWTLSYCRPSVTNR